ncbi:MAG: hypothetical protein ABW278_05340 [Steroidobacteraceae bacterium]
MKPSLFLAAAGFAVCAQLALAQLPAGITMEQVNTTLPEEGAPQAIAGPYAVATERAFGHDGLRIYRPGTLDNFPQRDTLPVVVWGNGGCAVDAPRYGGFLGTIASHGFLVITTAAGDAAAAPAAAAAPRRAATAADLAAAIDWAERENTRPGAPLSGRIDTRRVAVMGQSCGGRLAILVGADARVTTIGVFNAGLNASDIPLLSRLHGPVLLINGHERDFMMAPSKATYEAIDKLPAFYGARHGAGHTATAYHAGGGEFANVASAWARWQLKRDDKAGAMFRGAQCTLCTDSNWDVAAKRLGPLGL